MLQSASNETRVPIWRAPSLPRVERQPLVRDEPLAVRPSATAATATTAATAAGTFGVGREVKGPLEATGADRAEHGAGAADALMDGREPHPPRGLVGGEFLGGVMYAVLRPVALRDRTKHASTQLSCGPIRRFGELGALLLWVRSAQGLAPWRIRSGASNSDD